MNEYLIIAGVAVAVAVVVWLSSLFWEATKRKIKPFLTAGTVEKKTVKPRKRRTNFKTAVKRQNKAVTRQSKRDGDK